MGIVIVALTGGGFYVRIWMTCNLLTPHPERR